MEERPKPFSSEWVSAPAPPPERPRRLPPRAGRVLASIGRRLPGERALSILVVLILVAVSLGFAGPGSDARKSAPQGDNGQQLAASIVTTPASTPKPTLAPTLALADAKPTSPPTISTDPIKVKDGGVAAGSAQPATVTAPKLKIQEPQKQADPNGGLLPANRILTFYGFPGNEYMGILGEYGPDQLLAKLQETAKEWQDADPSRPVKIGFEVIASVAQKDPQSDGSYLADAPTSLLDQYTKFAEEHNILLFFDVQVGRRSVQDEVKSLEPWLAKPFVHLAIDPEFSMAPGEIPGEEIGQVDASAITWTQNYLAQLSKDKGIPPKVLIVHQFHYTMIEHKDQLAPVDGVQLVIDCDGWGTPDQKKDTYSVMNTQQPIQYNGVKLFYKQDVPLMKPAEVLQLNPVPDLIIYQ